MTVKADTVLLKISNAPTWENQIAITPLNKESARHFKLYSDVPNVSTHFQAA